MIEAVKISFKDYDTLTFGQWCDWQASGKSALKYFAKIDEDRYLSENTTFQSLIANWLTFLNEMPNCLELPKDKSNILEKSFAQKLDAIEIMNIYKDKQVLALPYIVAVFSQELYDRKQNEQIEKEVRQTAWSVAYPQAMYYLNALAKEEEFLKNSLIELRKEPEQIEAGVDELSVFGNYSAIDRLANGDILKHKEVLALSIAEVNFKMIYQNQVDYYLQKLRDVMRRKQEEASNKLKRR
jgi:hypothetical protein